MKTYNNKIQQNNFFVFFDFTNLLFCEQNSFCEKVVHTTFNITQIAKTT